MYPSLHSDKCENSERKNRIDHCHSAHDNKSVLQFYTDQMLSWCGDYIIVQVCTFSHYIMSFAFQLVLVDSVDLGFHLIILLCGFAVFFHPLSVFYIKFYCSTLGKANFTIISQIKLMFFLWFFLSLSLLNKNAKLNEYSNF